MSSTTAAHIQLCAFHAWITNSNWTFRGGREMESWLLTPLPPVFFGQLSHWQHCKSLLNTAVDGNRESLNCVSPCHRLRLCPSSSSPGWQSAPDCGTSQQPTACTVWLYRPFAMFSTLLLAHLCDSFLFLLCFNSVHFAFIFNTLYSLYDLTIITEVKFLNIYSDIEICLS